MALTPFNDNIQINAPKSLDAKYSKYSSGAGIPFNNVAEAQTAVTFYRSRGLTQLILRDGVATEYWYRDGITNGDLIPKIATIYTNDTQSLLITGDGTIQNPLYGDVQLSQVSNNLIQLFSDGLYVPEIIKQGVVYGGIVTWTSGYTYHVSAAGYYINGVFYTSPAGDFTLSSPDVTFNRIDSFIVDDTGTVLVLQGTPSSNPAQPSLNPATQLQLSFALVETGTTQPTLSVQCIYINNAEWTTLPSSGTFNPDSTNSPCNGTKSVEATAVFTGNNIKFTAPSVFAIAANYSVLKLSIRSKGAFGGRGNSRRKIYLQFRNGVTNVGSRITILNGSYGFIDTNIIDCQTIAIPITDFRFTQNSLVDNFLITIGGLGIIAGFWLDDICLQAIVVPPPPSGLTLTTNGSSGPSTYNTTSGILNIPIYGGITANNGLTANTATNVQLGGNLLVDTIIGTNIRTLTISTINSANPLHVSSTSVYAINANSVNSNALYGISINSNAIVGQADSIYSAGIYGQSKDGWGAFFMRDPTTTNSVVSIIVAQRQVQGGTAANGVGGSFDFNIQNSNGSSAISNQLISKWTDAIDVTRTSQFIITGTNSGTIGDILTLNGNKSIKANGYGAGTFTGTPTYTLQVDASGNIIEGALGGGGGGGFTTADNGLTASTSTNVQLGGTLLHHTNIDVTGNYTFSVGGTGALGRTTNFTITNQDITQGASHGNISTLTSAGVFEAEMQYKDLTTGAVRVNWIKVGDYIQLMNEYNNGVTDSIHHLDIYNDSIQMWSEGNTNLRLNLSGLANTVTSNILYINSITGEVTYGAVGGGGLTSITADNGLTANTGSNVQLGGTLVQNTTITGNDHDLIIRNDRSTLTSAISINNAGVSGYGLDVTGPTNAIKASSDNVAIYSSGVGYGVIGYSSSNIGIQAWSDANGGCPLDVETNQSSVGLATMIRIVRQSSGTVVNGIGGSIDFFTSTIGGVSQSNQLISKWTDATTTTRTSQFIITGTNSTVIEDLFTLSGSGSTKLNKYGVGTFTGTPTYTLQVDASGNIIEGTGAIGGGFVTADNGLTASTSTNVQLGGTLVQNTNISSASYKLSIGGTFDASSQGMVEINNATVLGGIGLKVTNTSPFQAAIFASGNAYGVSSTGNTGIYTFGTAIGLQTESNSGVSLICDVNPSSTNTVVEIAKFLRNSSGTAANGVGGSIGLYNQTVTGGSNLSNQLISKWTDATNATRTSQFIITGVNSGTTGDILTLNGNKSIKANGYGAGTFTGTPTYTLQVDATGNIIEGALGGGGSITANNGLNMSTATNVQLGGSALLSNTSILTSAFSLTILSSNATNTLNVTNTGSGVGIIATSAASLGVAGYSTGSTGVYGQTDNAFGVVGAATTSGTGVHATGNTSYGLFADSYDYIAAKFLTSNSSQSTVYPVIDLFRSTTGGGGVPLDGIGGSIDFHISETGGDAIANRLISKWTTVNTGTRTSQFIITGVNSTITADLFTLSGSGSTKLNKYGVGTFTGTPTYTLQSDASGNIIEGAVVISGTYTPTVTNGTNVTSNTAYQCQYMRVGSVVTVSGLVGINPTATSLATQITMSLPITSNFSATENAGGTGFSRAVGGPTTGITAGIFANASASTVTLDFYNTAGTSNAFRFSYTYIIQ